MEKDDDSTVFSPSFSTYSGNRLTEIAERVVRTVIEDDDYMERRDDDEFEFSIHQTESSSSGDGGVLVFPVFNQNLISVTETSETNDVLPSPVTVITPLKDLFLRERNDQPPQQTYSSSSDEEDELDAIPSEIYCPWTPARSTAEMSPSGGCRKSKSTGSSSTSSWSTKRWRIRDLLKRSHSDGKQSLKFLSSNSINKNYEEKSSKKKEKVSVSAHEKFYLKSKAMREGEKRKSYLPYKQDLVGLFANINRYGKTFPPF